MKSEIVSIRKRGGAGNRAWIEAGKRNLAEGRKKSHAPSPEELLRRGITDPAKCSERRRAQIAHEESMAAELSAEGYVVFSPTAVCDRVAIKGNKVYFVEFKKPGQELRIGQQVIHDLVPEMYIIRYK